MLSEKPWRLEPVLRLGLGLFGCMLLGAVVISLLGKSSEAAGVIPFQQMVVSSLSFHVAVFPLVRLFLREQQWSWSDAFGFRSSRQAHALLLAVGATAIALPAAWFLNEMSARTMKHLGTEPVLQTTVTTLQKTNEIAPQVFMAVMAIAVAPVAEEILFRGILYPFLKHRGFPRLAWWGTALLFGAVHANLMTLVPLVFLGLTLTWLYERTGNLLAPIFAHSLFNLANFFWLVMDRSGA